MPAPVLALALILLSSAARADSTLPWFGSDSFGDFQIADTTASVDKIAPGPQLKMSENVRCSGKTCLNRRNFVKASAATAGSPQ